MDFARKQLEKYGWQDGKGLGKHGLGISEAIKPKLKRSVTGIGHNAASDFTEHWWETLYDKASKNVEVEESNGRTKKIKTKQDSEFEITNSMWKLKKKKKRDGGQTEEQYSEFFVKKAVLTNGGAKTEFVGANDEDDDDDDDDEKQGKDALKMTDEELFAACGGRTAHKGARHGLKASGKLARIEQQEKMLLNLPQYEGYSKKCDKTVESKKDTDVKRDRNKKTKESNEEEIVCMETPESEPKRKKKKRQTESEMAGDFSNGVELSENETQIETKKKKKKNKCVNIALPDEGQEKNDLSKKKKKNRKD